MKAYFKENETDSLVEMIAEESQAFIISNTSMKDMDVILDSKYFDPNMQDFLEKPEIIDFSNDGNDDPKRFQLEVESMDKVLSILPRNNFLEHDAFRARKGRFNRLKKKMNKVFCSVINLLPEDWDLKTLIKKVVQAVLTFFRFGFPVLLGAFLVNLAVKAVKGGLARVCPV